MEQYISKAALVAEIEKLESRFQNGDDKDYADGYHYSLKLVKRILNTIEVKEVDVSNISENLAEAHEYLDYTSTGNLAHNKPMVIARLKKAIRGLFDARLFELTHDTKYRMENLGLKAQNG